MPTWSRVTRVTSSLKPCRPWVVLAVRPWSASMTSMASGSQPHSRARCLESVLEATALLVGEDLVRARLADVDEGLAAEVERGDEFGNAHG